jgi:glutamyl-tRNA reductase
VALRRHVEALRQDALAEAKGDAEAATRLLMGRLLHAPSEVLRDMAGAAAAEEVAGVEDMLRRLFRLGAVEERDE